MTLPENIAKVAAPAVGGIVYGAMGAAAGAFAGGVGASILNKAGYGGYVPLEAAQMGAIGGAVLSGAAGVVAGTLRSCGLFSNPSNENQGESNNSQHQAVTYAAHAVLAGLVGYGIMNATSHETVMQLAETAASFAVGGAVTMMPATWGLTCIALPLAAAAYYTQEEAYVPTSTDPHTSVRNELSMSAV